jgi:5-methylcytosine-specific restriction endonuclease McrA
MVRVAEAAIGVLDAGRPDAARRRRGRLTVQIDPLSGWARTADGEFLPPGTIRTDDQGRPVALRRITVADLTGTDLGRTERIVSPRLRRLLGAIDSECCRFPGCTRIANLDGHHVIYWSLGGRTDLANLVLLCEHHHTVVHAQGFQLTLHPDRTLEVRTADGTRLFHHPAVQPQHADLLDTAGGIGPATLPPHVTDPTIDLAYIVGVLLQHAA